MHIFLARKLRKIGRVITIFVVIFGWIFSGWPSIDLAGISNQVKVAKAASPWVENGTVDVSDSLSWTTINLTGSYATAPVVLATPVTTANCPGTCSGTTAGNGGMYPIPLVRNVSTTSFEISMCIDGGNTTCDTGASTETFHYFVFDIDDAANYDWIEVGTTSNVDVGGANTAQSYSTSFAATPYVWTQAQTYSQGGNIGAVAWVDDFTTSGFNYIGCSHTGAGDTCDSGGSNETFGYVAIDLANEAFPSEYNFQSGSASISNSDWTAASFSPSYTEPIVMVTQNDDNGGQDPQYAWAQSVATTGMEYRYCEEDAGNVCNTHTGELTNWFAMERQIAGANQLHFRWRDDTTALNTDGGWLAAEDSNGISDLSKGATYRLRMGVANASGSTEASARTYELQYGQGTDCAAISTWTGVGDSSTDDFEMVDSSNITSDGQATTALLSNSEGYTFLAGEGRDTADTTGSIGPLASNYYTELEYSFRPTDNAITGKDYCFRLYDTANTETLPSYFLYPQITLSYTNVSYTDIIMEWGTQSSVGDGGWTTINFTGSYDSPVFVCTTEYNANIGNESDGTADSIVCRVQNVGSTSAQVRLQESGTLVGDVGNLTNETIHWMVVEEGAYNTRDIKMEAFKFNSTVTDGKTNGWSGQAQTLTHSYTNPVVVGQVMTTNDKGHSQFWAHNGSNGPPTSASFYAGKHISEDNDLTRADETIGVIVVEQANNTLGSVAYEARLQTQTIDRIDDSPPSNYTFNSAFSSTPAVGIISLAGVSGTDGPYTTLYGATPLTTTNIYLVVMETEIVDTEQSGNTEYVPYIVFESVGTYSVVSNVAADQDTYRFYQNNGEIQPVTPLAAENVDISSIADATVVRIRMAVQLGGSIEASTIQFKLQYGQGATCSAIGTWVDVGGLGSGTIWRGYDNNSPPDGSTITASLLNSQSNALQSYEEANNSVSNPNIISDGSRGEWDWVIQNNGATGGTDYCFRMTKSDGSVLQYTHYPKITTATAISISLSTDGSIALGNVALNSSQDTTPAGINDVEVVSIDNGPVDLDIKSTVFSEGGNNWSLGVSNGSDQVQWAYSSSTSPWYTISTADTLYAFDYNVPESATRNVYLKITMPTDTTSFNQYSADVTIVASSP